MTSMGTNMSGMTQMGGSTMGGMMKPWLHFTMGDSILFMSWVPLSPGAVIGACIGLFMLAIIERWLSAMRSIMEGYWHQKNKEYVAARLTKLLDNRELSTGKKGTSAGFEDSEGESSPTQSSLAQHSGTIARLRRAAPFNPTYEFARGAIQIFQVALRYALMLTVMTFHAGYILAIILGSGVGEVLFGRFCVAVHNH